VQLSTRAIKTKVKRDAQLARNQTKIDNHNANPFYKDEIAKGYDADNLIDARIGLRDLVEESSNNEGEYKEVFTLSRMNTRSQTRVNRYYTHIEVKVDIKEAKVDIEFADD
jgi:predicted nucleotidyltransferase